MFIFDWIASKEPMLKKHLVGVYSRNLDCEVLPISFLCISIQSVHTTFYISTSSVGNLWYFEIHINFNNGENLIVGPQWPSRENQTNTS